MDLGSILQYLISGLTVGSTYGLTALGFTIIFNATRVINFAQGEFVMMGGMLAVFFMASLEVGLFPAIFLAVACTTLTGVLMERLAIRPVQGANVINIIIITIGVSIFIRGVVMIFLGKDTFVLPPFFGTEAIEFLGAAVIPQSIWILLITMFVLAGLRFFFNNTIFGKAMLACSFEQKAAHLVGISVDRMVMISFAISALVGSIGGVILTPVTLTSYDVGILLGLKGFAACILGGLGNPFGAAAGGLIIGVLESFGAGFISSAFKDAFAFIILLVILFVKPSGIFGRAEIERV
ncbi:branched-chain amino acid ABC transporter permease [Desulfonatronovibrio hydrogenovorans]|uniref:branched-chain amino acid ABC transporter permease n=1 Tax=Desulfonatronovibrio hydrogenovorans TaxID=53245 RepID=UPI00048F4186|nr:branched-chain amino acid ABC transporter permease [Desulfonatronovibrio hydrogenovorans]